MHNFYSLIPLIASLVTELKNAKNYRFKVNLETDLQQVEISANSTEK